MVLARGRLDLSPSMVRPSRSHHPHHLTNGVVGVDLLDYAIDATSDSVIGIDRSPFNYEASTLFTYLGGEQVPSFISPFVSSHLYSFL